VLSQHSKAALIPKNYILLLGDSHAQGYGEWLERADPRGTDPYHSAHVLQDLLGRDVLSYGRGGVGSIPGLVLLPARWDRALARFGLEQPDTVLVYFYEGNDLNNNLRYLRKHFPGGYDDPRVFDPDTFDAFLARELDDYLASKRWADVTLTLPFVNEQLRRLREIVRGSASPPQPVSETLPEPSVNRARLAGGVVEIPDGIQAPALELTPHELKLALFVADRSLAFLAEHYADARIHVIRIPAPLSSYEIASKRVHVQTYEGRSALYQAASVEQHCEIIGASLSASAQEHGMGFLDLRPAILEATRQRIVHGPSDWRHSNQEGYTLIGRKIAAYLAALGPRGVSTRR
jgi:hypothetical protein